MVLGHGVLQVSKFFAEHLTAEPVLILKISTVVSQIFWKVSQYNVLDSEVHGIPPVRRDTRIHLLVAQKFG